ncbi:ribonuclease Z [Candidatus Micrarchaeota archaeon CG_4_10_14_0_2_um_filter_60_11]|nr:MAG: ribonuclease Z [Candidatus Micrarchaeota archaeon CG1_02_60_51]PIN96322.1 MAG: ribonuclease Z [Candidatus Micrarchaeota archaeon CG10_big_fil_rev_8_21_14_0_10_60_32]PIO01943.1 MAG: ribonuclease Z [Candidatus Micrarchaeota archaeon CG09_land_8_20_14_0_10_60_16]PIY91181.1 MAG: ribonuclease Z [Candidatus Micrarchaeota archaeon CG_4_10_14_0_8_um_filter_60_7]PIZ90941.1 MAG: ribonuclease Z [Candidatus Micrarchaeota archaeon CG_4_10_14_0_2_um_filter_60_11]
MIKVTFLGSSASLPSPRHHSSCFAVTCGGVYLFDACEGCQRQMMKNNASYGRIKAVFLSHLHADHFLGLFGLVQTMNLIGRTEPLRVYGPRGTKQFLSSVFALRQLAPAFPVEIKDCGEGECLRAEFFTISCFPVEHGCPALGFVLEEPEKTRFYEDKAKAAGIKGELFTRLLEKGKIKIGKKAVKLEDVSYRQKGKKLVYSGDTAPCRTLAEAAKGADLLIHDSCFSQSEAAMAAEKKHATATQAAELAVKAKAGRLALTHFSNRYEDRKPLLAEAKKIFPETVAAEEGLELSL